MKAEQKLEKIENFFDKPDIIKLLILHRNFCEFAPEQFDMSPRYLLLITDNNEVIMVTTTASKKMYSTAV